MKSYRLTISVVLILGILAFTLLPTRALAPSLDFAVVVTNSQLVSEILNSRKYKEFYQINEWYGWAAYYAGREAYAMELRDQLWASFGMVTPPAEPIILNPFSSDPVLANPVPAGPATP